MDDVKQNILSKTMDIEEIYIDFKIIFFNWFWIASGGVIVSVHASSEVDCEFEHWSGQTNDYENGICCLSANYESLRGKSKDLLARNQDNVTEWSRQSFRWASTIEIQLSMLV